MILTGHYSLITYGDNPTPGLNSSVLATSIQMHSASVGLPDFTGIDEGSSEVPGEPDLIRFTGFTAVVLFDTEVGLPGFRVDNPWGYVRVTLPRDAGSTFNAYWEAPGWTVSHSGPLLASNTPMVAQVAFRWTTFPQYSPET
jgi:hypothetical protein